MAAELHVMHVNVNSVRSKRTELELYLREVKPHIVCLNETKLCGKSMPRFAGFKTAAVRDRTVGKTCGGGVAILVSSTIICSDVSPDTDDIVAIELHMGQTKYAVIAYYWPPGNSDLNLGVLNQFVLKYERMILMEDLNARHQYFGSKSSDARGGELLDFVERNDLIVANNASQMTRYDVRTGKSDLIDYAVVSRPAAGRYTESHVGESIGSEHSSLHLTVKLQCQIASVPTKEVRILAKCDWALFSLHLAEASAVSNARALTSEADIAERCDEIRRSIADAIDLACPKRKVKAFAFRLRPDTVNLIRLKRKLPRMREASRAPRGCQRRAHERLG